uniref:CDP-diacylglycerol--glycerol-3-phosphate 3-phosphatidyltransferase n=1 Tax=Panagrolaimus sp. PS1159 TaxID=55785 RepID=A0AC35GKD4_9BILA
MDWLIGDKPSLPVNSEDVYFIKTPKEFYATLLERIKTSKKRVIFSSLYLGTGDLEVDLINTLKESLESNPDIKISILLDYLRGTRPSPVKSSATLLSTIAEKANIFFYHTPDLRGIKKNYLPAKFNEIVGLQHMKFYIFDDSVIISGANLSDQYFLNRQDRYVLIENNPKLVEFLENIFNTVAESSFQLKGNGALVLRDNCIHPFEGNKVDFCEHVSTQVRSILLSLHTEPTESMTSHSSTTSDTRIYPFLQFPPFKINDEVEILMKLFSHSENDINVTVATGYFNLYDDYLDAILKKSNYPLTFLTAAPDANGFYNGQGLSGYVPSLYVNTSKYLFDQTKIHQKQIKILEYSRPNWTFHGKGIWIDDEKNGLTATMIGSSNFGYRSVSRDLEAQVMLVTSNEKLRTRLKEEKNLLMEYTSLLESATFLRRDHFVPFWVKIFARHFRNFF